MVACLIVEMVTELPPADRIKPISFLCTDTRVEIPAIVEMIEGTLSRIRKFSETENLNIDVHLLRPPAEQSFWVNVIGRGYPPPNRTFRWCTQRMKIDPVTDFVKRRMQNGRWSEAIIHLGARRNESATRSRAMGKRETRNNLRRHEDMPNVWINNPIEFLSTEEVWAYLLQRPNPWGGSNRELYALYSNASGANARWWWTVPRRVVETHVLAAGLAQWLSATKLARGFSKAEMNAWSTCLDSAIRSWSSAIQTMAGATCGG